MLFRKKPARTCPNGHELEEGWERCPHCTRAESAPDGSAEEGRDGPDPVAIVVAKKPPKPTLRGWLVVLEGEQQGKDFRLHAGRNVIGKGSGVDVLVKDAHVSERHASIEIGPREATVTDLESKRGTQLNGRVADGPTRLRDGDRIRVGNTELKYRSFDG